MESIQSPGILLEPLNRCETDLVNIATQAADIISSFGTSKLRILLDTFHMNLEEDDVDHAFWSIDCLLGHIHIADSDRMPPGLGSIDLDCYINLLRHIKYRGFVSAEILPFPSIVESFQLAANFLSRSSISTLD